MTCSFEVTCPALELLVAKEIRIEGFSFPDTCLEYINIPLILCNWLQYEKI